MTKRKLSLISGLAVSLFAIVTASVSTFAWFQAEANVTIQTSGSSTTITVTKPDDFVFYGYRGNTDPNHEVGETDVNEDEEQTFEDDFEQITSSNLDAMTKFTGETGESTKFNPGDIKCFAVKFSDHTSGDNVSLKIKKLVSTTINDLNASKHRTQKQDANRYEINIGWAIDIYSMYVGGSTPAVSSYSTFVESLKGKVTDEGSNGTDRFTITSGSETQIARSDDGSTLIRTLTTPIDVFPAAAKTDSAGYVFYSVVFNDDLTTRFAEVTSNVDNTILLEPSTNNTRYFIRNTSSSTDYKYNSNCYAGLKFAITEMEFAF